MKTDERLPVEVLIRDSKTKSEQIRKLATSGYSRTEIAKGLGIRYQHVRKVLVDAGITDGLRLPNVPQPTAVLDASSFPKTPSSVLLEASFKEVGEWTRTEGGGIATSVRTPAESGVYVFALDDVVVYVGSTTRPLRDCMYQYQRGDTRQRTRARVNGLIKTSLAAGGRIKILVASPALAEWNGLPVSTAVGLEAGLIRMIGPEWNILLRNLPKT